MSELKCIEFDEHKLLTPGSLYHLHNIVVYIDRNIYLTLEEVNGIFPLNLFSKDGERFDKYLLKNSIVWKEIYSSLNN